MFKLICALALATFATSACSAGRNPAVSNADATPATRVTPAPAATAVTPAVREAITATIQRMAPGARVQAIAPMPIAGLYQVVAQGQVLYLSGDGRYVIQGDAYDVKTHTPLNSQTMDRLRRDAIAKLSPAQMIRYGPAKPKYTVTVFTDVDCPYCRAFHANIAAINKLGIAVDYLFWPRSGLGTPSAQKAIDVWCASNRETALTRAFEGRTPQRAACQSPVARDFNLGVDLGVDGTPTVIADNGVVLGGYVDPRELLRRLQEVHARPQGG
ncbi:MAG: DsbC family protein [Rhodanobacteraceae bacterium]|nr:MAG: DsbC family protein [Rhodanobacteraceae bacterium]